MREISLIKKNILKYLDFKGVSKYEFYKHTGVSNGVLSQSSGMSEENTLRFLNYYKDVNPTWLITGEGEMIFNGTGITSQVVHEPTEPYAEPKGYPLLPLEAFGGNGDDSALGIETSKIQERYVVPLFEGLKIDFMIPVRGSSMYPKYNSGDVVACRIIKDLLYVQWNKTYVIDTYTQGTLLKRLKKSTVEDQVICKSDNKDYDEFELPKKDIRNIAMVVGVIRLE